MAIGNILFNPALQSNKQIQANRKADVNFVKNTFNFSPNLNCPVARVCNSPLGDPDRAAVLDVLA